MADRYTYVPSIGLFLIAVWGAGDFIDKYQLHRFRSKRFSVVIAIAFVMCYAACSWAQVRYWRDSSTLFKRALEVNPNNPGMHNNLDNVLKSQGKLDRAIFHYQRATRIKRHYASAFYNLALVYEEKGDQEAAIKHYLKALRFKADFPKAHNNLGILLFSRSDIDGAIRHFRLSLKSHGDKAKVYCNLGLAMKVKAEYSQAADCFKKAAKLSRDYVGRLTECAWHLSTMPDVRMPDRIYGIELAEHAAELTDSKNANILDMLAAAYASAGQFDKAVKAAASAIKLAAEDR